MDDVVAQPLPADLPENLLSLGEECRAGCPAVDDLPYLEVVGGDPVLEQNGGERVPQRLEEVGGYPLLILVDPHDAVAEVVVAAEHVGIGVVEFVVTVLPQVRWAGVVPLPRRRVDLRVAHPVPLAVHDVVADLHVLEDLGDRQAGRSDQPGGREQRAQQDDAAGQLERALHLDDAADVGSVIGPSALEDVASDGVQFVGQHFDVGRSQMVDRAVWLVL